MQIFEENVQIKPEFAEMQIGIGKPSKFTDITTRFASTLRMLFKPP